MVVYGGRLITCDELSKERSHAESADAKSRGNSPPGSRMSLRHQSAMAI